jgi:hypothetical protein
MVAARSATRGLSTPDLQAIRDTLAAGRKPKVMFTEAAGQIAGQIGQVVQLTDPDGNDEFVVVRFGRDELPFSPTDLRIPPRGTSARKTAAEPKPAPEQPKSPAPELRLTEPPSVPAPRGERRMSMPNVDAPPPPPAAPAGEGAAKPAPRKATRQAKPKALANLTVTLAYTEGEWTVSAQQGSKVLAKPYVIKPTEALKMVGLLDVPGVQEAVEQIVSTERAEAESHARQLRAQLAEIEARLAELGDLS